MKEVKSLLRYPQCKNGAAKLRTKQNLAEKIVWCNHFDHDYLTTKTNNILGAQGLLM